MAQTATFFILEKKDLELLYKESEEASVTKKSWLGMMKKSSESISKKLDSFAIEKINYRWSGLAFAIFAVFSREKLGSNWDNLEYSRLAGELTVKTNGGIYIFSIHDKELLKLKPTGLFYSIEELEQFAIEFEGNKPGNPDIMKNAVKVLDQALSKLSNEKVVLLLIE